MTAQTSADTAQPAVADSGEFNEESDASFSDQASSAPGTAQGGEEGTDGTDAKAGHEDAEGGTRNREKDAAAAQKRREGQQSRGGKADRDESARREVDRVREETRVSAIIEAHDGINPYNGKPMKDAADVRTYLAMKEISKAGGDPVSDFAEFTAKQERESAERQRKTEEKNAWFASDRDAFQSAYPDVDVNELVHDPEFNEYAEGKVGTVPLAKIYERFLSFVARQTKKGEDAANRRVAQAAAQKAASPGSLTGQGTEVRFTREQVKKMSQKEVRDNYDAIIESSKYW